MIFNETPLKGAYVIEPELIEDERGFFAQVQCKTQFEDRDLEFLFPWSSIAYNYRTGTLRGMHFQKSPHQEIKLIRCLRGSVQDVIIDLRPKSVTYCKWFSIVLSSWNRKSLYIPEDFAHGYLTLVPDCEVLYQLSEEYNKRSEGGVLWNDPQFKIDWVGTPKIISERDRNHTNWGYEKC